MSHEHRCVFDTNCIVSAAILSESLPAAAYFFALDHALVLVSEPTIGELRLVLGRKKFDKYVDPGDRKRFLAKTVQRAAIVDATQTVRACRDPRDDKILELAVSGGASFIVSGDKDLLVLHPFRGIPILTPSDFLRTVDPTNPALASQKP